MNQSCIDKKTCGVRLVQTHLFAAPYLMLIGKRSSGNCQESRIRSKVWKFKIEEHFAGVAFVRNGLSKNGFKNRSLIKLSLKMGHNSCCDMSRSDCFLSLDYSI